MERRRRGGVAPDSQPGRSNRAAHDDVVGPSSESSTEERQPQSSPRRSRRIARQVQQTENDHQTDQESQVFHVSSQVESTRRNDRSNQSIAQRSSVSGRSNPRGGGRRQSNSSPIEFIVVFERQPPAEVRTGVRLPEFIVKLQLRSRGLDGSEPPIDDSNLNAMAALVAADGETPMASVGNDIIMRPLTATPRQHYTIARDGMWWNFVFAPGEIFASGYFRIRIVVMHTPTEDHGTGLELNSPIQLLSITSHLIHVHSFAPPFWVGLIFIPNNCEHCANFQSMQYGDDQ
ncbi:MAG: hypothetical protein Q9164_005908 [Protoblastenia rupestris]